MYKHKNTWIEGEAREYVKYPYFGRSCRTFGLKGIPARWEMNLATIFDPEPCSFLQTSGKSMKKKARMGRSEQRMGWGWIMRRGVEGKSEGRCKFGFQKGQPEERRGREVGKGHEAQI
ncbi:hypothetical protein D8674_015146 [Pyrus ussuriensis x Pyrus communis]|uniref:Uncharacterized protein n=1 Tax=Pyrus ussuriensis x Pyrus communis TaxID=2448454 RepID=A0A5N5GVV4_9ROSA|nr:hypothetical protein D8674_015146 [Pyrus ussuriensis x Pyrus communis]